MLGSIPAPATEEKMKGKPHDSPDCSCVPCKTWIENTFRKALEGNFLDVPIYRPKYPITFITMTLLIDEKDK
jgi:hypothetical protein